MKRDSQFRADYGRRPATPVIEKTRPDDWLCCWKPVYEKDGSGKWAVTGWQLSFINAACHHARLASR